MTHIAPSAQIHPSVQLGPGAVVGEHARLGEGCKLEAYAIIGPCTEIGKDNHIHSFAVIGGLAQDHRTPPNGPFRLICGDGNVFREGVTCRGAVPWRRSDEDRKSQSFYGERAHWP